MPQQHLRNVENDIIRIILIQMVVYMNQNAPLHTSAYDNIEIKDNKIKWLLCKLPLKLKTFDIISSITTYASYVMYV